MVDANPERTLYKATVHMRWSNRATGAWNDVFGGQVVDFDEFDFATAEDLAADQRPPFTCLTSLEDVLASGAFVVFDPAKAREVESMGRDEMLELLSANGQDELLKTMGGHQASEDELRPLVRNLFAVEDAAAVEAAP